MENRYKFLEDVFNENNSLEDEYLHYRSVIEYKLNNGEIAYLIWWIIFFQRKLKKMGINYKSDKEILPYVLDLLGKLLKEREIKIKRVKIYEWKDKSKGDWYIEYSGDIDPCKVNNDKELEGLIDEWKEEVLNQYEELVNKYGERSADSLFDLIPIERSECYEGEIKID